MRLDVEEEMYRITLAVALCVAGCDAPLDLLPADGIVHCAAGETNIKSDPTACGGCPGIGEACPPGVACIDYYCDYTSVVHCGVKGRACLGDGASCIRVDDYGAEDRPPHGEVVRGYACTSVADDVDERDGKADPIEGEGVEVLPSKRPALAAPQWLLVPGISEGCHRGDLLRCHHAFVEMIDICGERCGEVPFDYDYRVMMTEMSRAQYRDAVCDCERVRTEQCADVCDPEKAARDALPMTGLNWCMAQSACQAVGGRLPTAMERARLEQLASAERALFTGANCQEWQRRAGSQPRVGECIDLDGAAELIAVDDPRGAMGAGAGVSPAPPTLYHPLGNASEWLLDPAAQIRCGELEDPETRLRVPQGWEGVGAIQGRSVMSPRGEPVTQVAVAPGTRAVDLGVRCVQADGGPSIHELPLPLDHCEDDAPLGRAAVRRSVSDSLYRAVEACPVSRQPSAAGRDKLDRFVDPLVDGRRPLVWSQEREAQIGQAWFTPDAQWWIGQPAGEGAALSFEFYPPIVTWMMWAGFGPAEGTACAARMSAEHPEHDGHLVRQLDLVVERAQLATIFSRDDSASLACTHFECADPTEDEACESTCTAWRLSVVIGFERIEPFDHPDLCE